MTWSQSRDRNRLGFWVEIQKFLVLARGSKSFWFLCGGIEIDLILEWVSIWHDFSSGVESNLIFVWGIKLDLVLVLGSKLTCFLCGGSKKTVCEPKLTYLLCGDRLTWFLCAGRNWLGFWMRAANRLVLVWTPKLACFLSGSSIVTWFSAGERTWPDLSFGIGIDLVWSDLSVGIGINLVYVLA